MSLVAYGASDDDQSDASETEEETTDVSSVTTSSHKVSSPGHISDEDDYDPITAHQQNEQKNNHVSSTSASKRVFESGAATDLLANHIAQSKAENENSQVNPTTTSLEGLPAPQKTDIIAEGDLEDEVKPKEYEIASAPKPPPKKTRQPVKITIPALEEADDDGCQGSKKNAQPSTKKSGLFSLLPAPIHSAKKEINRPLIPHSLKKKVPTITESSTARATISQKHSSNVDTDKAETDVFFKRMSQFNALTGYDSDSEEENDEQGSSVNFFSIDAESKASSTSSFTPTSAPHVQNGQAESRKQNLQMQSVATVGDTKKLQSQEISSSDVSVPSLHKETVSATVEDGQPESTPEPGAVNDAPLDFGLHSSGLTHLSMHSSQSFLSPVGSSGPVEPLSYGSSSSAMYNMANMEEPSTGDNDVDAQPVSNEDLRQFMSEKEFSRLQGKRKRGMEGEINFVDANVDDYVDPSEVSKHLTEETEYVSKKHKDDLPTSQQKRKKQITYLAHQAKERELELKNQWAQNRNTKKQTQSKYGF